MRKKHQKRGIGVSHRFKLQEMSVTEGTESRAPMQQKTNVEGKKEMVAEPPRSEVVLTKLGKGAEPDDPKQ